MPVFSCGQLRGGSRIASVQTASWSVFQRVMLTWHESMPRFIFFLRERIFGDRLVQSRMIEEECDGIWRNF